MQLFFKAPVVIYSYNVVGCSFRAFVVYDHENFDLPLFVANSTLLGRLRQYVMAKIIVSFSRRMRCDIFVRQNYDYDNLFYKVRT